MSTIEYLRAQDATLWCVQADDAPLQIGALCLFEGAPLRDTTGSLRVEELRRHVEARLDPLPRFRQRIVAVPFDQGLVWVDDETFDISDHVRVVALPQPGGDRELRELMQYLLEVPLDPARPLWEFWFVEGVAGDRIAVIPKVSHVMADGMAILEFALSVLDTEPRTHDDAPSEWVPGPSPDAGPLLFSAIVERAQRQIGALWNLAEEATNVSRLTNAARAVVRLATKGSGRAPALPITRPVGSQRDFAWIGLPRAGLEQVKRAEGVTLNDVVLSVVGGGLAHYLGRHGGHDGINARVLVPVSTHGRAAGEEIENRFTMMVTDVPTAVSDPIERLRAVHAEMRAHKESAQATVGPLLFSLGQLVPPWLLRAAGPLVLRHQPFVNLAVTNLPGTREPMYLLESRMLGLYPYVGVTGNIAVIIGVISYQDALGVGITVDADVVPDVDRLVEGIERAARELVLCARGGT